MLDSLFAAPLPGSYIDLSGRAALAFIASGFVRGLHSRAFSLRSLARASELFRWLLILALVHPAAWHAGDRRKESFFRYISPMLCGSGRRSAGPGRRRFSDSQYGFSGPGTRQVQARPLRAVGGLLMFLVVAVTLGHFGPELTGRLTYPFFALVRNTSVFGITERIEALVTALWVFSDFVLFTFSIAAGASCLRSAPGSRSGRPGRAPRPARTPPGTLGAVALCGFRRRSRRVHRPGLCKASSWSQSSLRLA